MNPAATPESFSPYSPPAAAPERKVYAVDTVGGMLSEAWQRFSERPFLLIGAFLVIWLPLDLLIAVLDRNYFGPEDFFKSFRFQRMLEVWIGSWAAAALIFAAAPASGIRSVGQALSQGSGRWARLVGARIVSGLALIGSALLLILPAFYVGVRLSLVDYAATLEGKGATDSLRRSWQLSQGRFGFLLRTNLVAYGLPLVITAIPAFAYGMIVQYFPALDLLILDWLLGSFTSCLLAFSIVCMQVIYEEISRQQAALGELAAAPAAPGIPAAAEATAA